MSATTAPILSDIETLQRAFQRELRARPTTLQRALIDRAALLTVKAEHAAVDPNVSANDLVRLDNLAKRARREMFESFKRKQSAADAAWDAMWAAP